MFEMSRYFWRIYDLFALLRRYQLTGAPVICAVEYELFCRLYDQTLIDNRLRYIADYFIVDGCNQAEALIRKRAEQIYGISLAECARKTQLKVVESAPNIARIYSRIFMSNAA